MAKAGILAIAGTAAGAGAEGLGAVVGAVIGAIGGPADMAVCALAGSAFGAAVISPIAVRVYWRYKRRKSSTK